MIENETKATQTAQLTGNTTSPISKEVKKESSKKTNAFVAWLKDEDTIDESDGKISAKVATASYVKGLGEIVKTLYKKPLASAIAIATGIILTFYAHFAAITVVMGIAVASGLAGAAYAIYSIATAKSSNQKKQAYEVLGVSTFVLAIGIYGLLM